MLLEAGSIEAMENEVKRWTEEREEEKIDGGWVTESMLEADGWTKCLA